MSNNPTSLFSVVLEKYVFDRFWKADLDNIYYLALKNSFSNSSSKPKAKEKQMGICISQQSICIKKCTGGSSSEILTASLIAFLLFFSLSEEKIQLGWQVTEQFALKIFYRQRG